MKVPSFGLLVLVGAALLSGCGGDNQQEDDREATRTALAQPTATPTDTPTGTPTDTPTQTPTVTNTPPPSNTPTITPTATETPTGERPTVTPLGERLFTIANPTGGLNTPPDMTRTGLFTTGINGNNAATSFAAQDFTLIGGMPDGNGVAPLTLGEDFVFAVGNPISVVCFRIRAEGSSGSIDCDGGTAVDLRITQEGGTSAPPPVLESGLGEDGGPGAAFLMVTQESVQLAGTATLDDCLTATYDPPVTTIYTTGMATAVKGDRTLDAPAGENFRCDTFRDTDSAGMLINPSVANNPPVGDVANILRLADNAELPATPTATVPGAETPTPTPTLGAPPIGERLFTILPPSGGLNTPPSMTRTGLFSTGLGGNNVATSFGAQDFTLVAGPEDENGVASLTLKEDFIFATGNPISLVCFRVRAAGSTGEIDCDGGTSVDVTLTQDAGVGAPPPVLETGVGPDGGPGAAILMVTQESVQITTPGATFNDCLTATFDPPTTTVYTTGTATATKGDRVLSMPTGENFDCDAFTTTDGPGMLINPSTANNPPVGDVANILRLADAAAAP